MAKLLIADDHQLVVDGLLALFDEAPGIDVLGYANNGREAVQLTEMLQPDVVLMDVDMPVLNGIEATTQIKHKCPKVKVIILTMHDEPSLIRKMVDIGADGYFLKNATRAELLSGIEQVMAHQKKFPSHLVSGNVRRDNAFASATDVLLLSQLTEREIEILKLICEGLTNKEIGDRLFISHRTVDTHRTHLMRKLEVNNIAGMVRFAVRCGLLE